MFVRKRRRASSQFQVPESSGFLLSKWVILRSRGRKLMPHPSQGTALKICAIKEISWSLSSVPVWCQPHGLLRHSKVTATENTSRRGQSEVRSQLWRTSPRDQLICSINSWHDKGPQSHIVGSESMCLPLTTDISITALPPTHLDLCKKQQGRGSFLRGPVIFPRETWHSSNGLSKWLDCIMHLNGPEH